MQRRTRGGDSIGTCQVIEMGEVVCNQIDWCFSVSLDFRQEHFRLKRHTAYERYPLDPGLRATEIERYRMETTAVRCRGGKFGKQVGVEGGSRQHISYPSDVCKKKDHVL